MTKFKEGTWIYDGGNTVHKVTLCSCDMEWTDKWKELKRAPNLNVVEKKVLLSEVEPEVRMLISYRGNKPHTIVAVGDVDVCVRDTDGRLVTIFKSIYDRYEVVNTEETTQTEGGTPAHRRCEEPRLLSVEESLMPEHFGKFGKWLNRIGEEISGRLDKTTGEHEYKLMYPVTIMGHTYTREGRFYKRGERSDNDLSTFLGWENNNGNT